MASPQKENGYTPIANELFEAFYRCKLLEYERVCVMHIWRKTYGWNKKGDWIANSQFAEETGIPRPHIARTLKALLDKKIIQRGIRNISVNKNYEEWVVEWRVTSPGNRVTSPGNESLPHQVPTKESKATIQKKLASDDAKNNMAWKKYNENQHSEDVPSIDMDSGEKIEDKSDQESKQVTQLIEWAEKVRGQKFLDRPTQRKFAYQLKSANLSLSEIRQTYMTLLNSEYWKEQKRLPDLKTVYSNLKNKKHE